MEETLSVRNSLCHVSDYNECLVECCVCRRAMSDPVILKCLHSGCRRCFLGDSNTGSSSTGKCPACCEATPLSAIMSNSFLCNYGRLSALSSEVLNCQTCDAESLAAAVFWCADCCMALCDSCYSWHNRFNRRHRSAELDTARTWSVSQLTPSVQCITHKLQMEVLCITCREPKCLLCNESCRGSQHELHPLSHANARRHIVSVVESVTSVREQLYCRISGLQQRCRETIRNIKVNHRKVSLKKIAQDKRSLQDSTVNVFDNTVREVCVILERIWCMCMTVIARPLCDCASFAARSIEWLPLERSTRMDLLRMESLLKGAVNRWASSLATLLRLRRKFWQENGNFSIGGSLSLTCAIVLRSCLGTTEHRAVLMVANDAHWATHRLLHKLLAAPRAPVRFDQIPVTFRTHVDCVGLAVTRDGHVLLAALQHGLLVYSSRGQQLSSWIPEIQSTGEEDEVLCVAILHDGRAAVGVGYAQIVVLLRPSETGDRWLEDRRVAVLQSPPWRLAVYSDLLAAAGYRLDEQQQEWVMGPQVALLRLSSGHLLCTQSREYGISSVALTALCLLTVSSGRVKRNSGARPFVLDAYSHLGEFLWRHETSDEEGVTALCVSVDTWNRVYAAVWRNDRSSSRIMAVSGSDGRDMREVMSTRTHGLQLPTVVSLARGQQRTVLAVLSWDREAAQYRTVSLYEASREQ